MTDRRPLQIGKLQVWVSPFLRERTIDGDLRIFYYTRVPIHFDSAWCFLRIWIVCFQWL